MMRFAVTETRLSGIAFAVCMVSLLLLATPGSARQFRQIKPIATPQNEAAGLPEGAVPLETVTPLTRAEVEPLVRESLAKWNTPQMAESLSEAFFDRRRLLDAVDTLVPRDAKLTVQAVQGIQTLQQFVVPGADGGRGDIVSVVSATVRTQLEFNSPTDGFQRRPGTSEFILEIRTPAPPAMP